MVQSKLLIIRRLCGVLLSSITLLASPAAADTRWAEVEFANTIEPEILSAIIFSNSTSIQTAEATISGTSNGKTIVAIPFDSDIVSQDHYFAYAIAQTPEGALHYSTIVPASPQYDLASGYAQPACIPKEVPSSMQSQMSLVANLLKVRTQRRENSRQQVEATLSGEFLDKMLKYESGFGLQFGAPLAADMPAAELVDRLERILHTLRKVAPQKTSR